MVLNGNISDFAVSYNLIYSNDNIGIDFAGFEEGNDTEINRARDGKCVGNIVYHISSLTNKTYAGAAADGIYVDGGKNIRISDNIVMGCDIGIEAASEHAGHAADGISIKNNLVLKCRNVAGISIGGSGNENGSANGCSVSRNTVLAAGSGIVLQKTSFGGGKKKNSITANIISGCSTALEFSDAFYNTSELPDLKNNLFSKNHISDFSYYLSGDDSESILKNKFSGQIYTGHPVFQDTVSYTQMISEIKRVKAAADSNTLTGMVKTFYARKEAGDSGYDAKEAWNRRKAALE